jgi:3-isopropylmalate/(R)-2-methylmalate dehydratase large subunit
MEGRMTLCNMATEFAAFTAIIAPDAATLAYLKRRRFAPDPLPDWSDLTSDPDAHFVHDIHVDASAIEPMISWGTSPEHSIPISGTIPQSGDTKALGYIGLSAGQPIAGVRIDAAFIGSCTNARLSDLRRAADQLKGQRIASSVHGLVVPGSSSVKRAAEAEGLDRIFTDAGFEWRESGCSLCFYAGGEGFPVGSRILSSTNRNFEGRQGPGVRTHIASPETVAASAIAGVITAP